MAIALGLCQGIGDCPGGRRDIIEQADFTKVEVERQMKPEGVVVKGLGGELQKFHLACNAETRLAVLDLRVGQSGFL